MSKNLNDQDILLVKEKSSNELHAANMDKHGEVKMTKLNEEKNPDFLKIDKRGNILENFYENFRRQVKEPTRFEFFRVPLEKFNDIVQTLQEAFKSPDAPQNKAFLDLHRIEPDSFQHKQNPEQAEGKNYAIQPELVNWEQFERYGVNRERLEASGNVEKLLDYHKTDLLPVAIKFDDETLRSDARFSLRKQDDGTFSPNIHLIRHKPDLERPYFGVRFSEEDRHNLLTGGNLGRVVEAEFQKGEKTPVFLSLDKLTNELVAFRKEWVKAPETYKGVPLSDEQKQRLNSGEKISVEGMTSTKGKPFDGEVQFNADKRYFELIFNNDKKQSQKQAAEQGDVPQTFRGKALSEQQRDSLREQKTVFVDGLMDRKGKGYAGYVTLNKESGKLDFMFPKDYKEAVAEGKAVPDDRYKTQIAAKPSQEARSENKLSSEMEKLQCISQKGYDGVKIIFPNPKDSPLKNEFLEKYNLKNDYDSTYFNQLESTYADSAEGRNQSLQVAEKHSNNMRSTALAELNKLNLAVKQEDAPHKKEVKQEKQENPQKSKKMKI